MSNTKVFTLGFIVVVILAIAGLTLYNVPATQTGGIPSPVNSLIPNYALYTAKKTVSPFTLGPVLSATSSATTSVTLPRGLMYGLNLGDTCQVQLTSASSTNGYSQDAQITSIATGTATVTVTFFNAANANLTINTGTLTVICQNY